MSNPITKEHFVACIEVMKAADDMAAEINRIAEKYKRSDFIDGYVFNDDACQTKLIETLELIFNDKDHWISWWVYETNYGQSTFCRPTVYNDNGTIHRYIHDAETLYDFITQENL